MTYNHYNIELLVTQNMKRRVSLKHTSSLLHEIKFSVERFRKVYFLKWLLSFIILLSIFRKGIFLVKILKYTFVPLSFGLFLFCVLKFLFWPFIFDFFFILVLLSIFMSIVSFHNFFFFLPRSRKSLHSMAFYN